MAETDGGLFAQARDEIRRLQHANEILGAKVETMELFACVLHTRAAHPDQGLGEDISWKLQRRIDELAAERAKTAPDGKSDG